MNEFSTFGPGLMQVPMEHAQEEGGGWSGGKQGDMQDTASNS